MATVIEEIPLAKDSHGVYRVGGTCVTLDLVVRAFNRGATAEEIVQKFIGTVSECAKPRGASLRRFPTTSSLGVCWCGGIDGLRLLCKSW